MYLATKERSARSSFAERISSGDVAAHWLIDGERGGAGHGKIGVIEIKPGGTASLLPEANNEDMVYVLRGRGVARIEGSADRHPRRTSHLHTGWEFAGAAGRR